MAPLILKVDSLISPTAKQWRSEFLLAMLQISDDDGIWSAQFPEIVAQPN